MITINLATPNRVESTVCMEIEGDVTISGSGITNLFGLNVVTHIGGSLEIYDNDSLINL